MHVTMTWHPATEEEEAELAELVKRLKAVRIGTNVAMRATGTIEVVEEGEETGTSDADYARYTRLIAGLLTMPTRMGLVSVQDVVMLLAVEFNIGEGE